MSDKKSSKSTKRIVAKKDDLIAGIATSTGETKVAVAKILNAYPQEVVDILKANPPKAGELVAVPLPGFGTMGIKTVPAREAKNNFTGETYTVPEHNTVTMRIAKSIKIAVNQEPLAAAKSTKPAASKKKPA